MTLVELSCLSHMSDICDTFHTYTHFTHVLYWITKQVERRKKWRRMISLCVFSWALLTQELSITYPQNFCMSPNLFKLAWMKDPYGYMNLPEYGFPQRPYSPARAISKIGVYFGSKFSNCHIGLRFNLRSISFNV